MGEAPGNLVGLAIVLVLYLVALVGPAWAIGRLQNLSPLVRRGAYVAAALLILIPVMLDVRSGLYLADVRQVRGGATPEAIRAKPISDRVMEDPIHRGYFKRVVVWEDSWSGNGLAAEYSVRTGRSVGVTETAFDAPRTALAWLLHIAALSAIVGVAGAGVGRIRQRIAGWRSRRTTRRS